MMTKSQTECTATAKKFEYNCNVLFLHKKKTMSGYSGIVGATMPSMAMAHNVKPVKFTEKEGMAGHYEFIIQLEMLGEWMFQYDISQPKRDRVMEKLIFDKTKSIASHKKHNHSHHKHSEHDH
tara:strand:- start:634 stop:1002 length:369 start_codon:yes stop_codon:yes gene_type:complete